MVVGRLTHYGIDLVMVSVILAGVKRTSGFGLAPQNIGVPEGTPKNIADGYLKFGESIFDYACALSYGSSYFEREGKSMTKP
ncbi:DUF1748-domain-containing protein [Cystobasidium minutum MCA 4210]|uniref:DUF1748-domain-containing protein n=1 Tax=Cystobasidium minutum MCA 4210 TaxID=1397322 RepID=UPI0034CDABE7|eukprot:jgi/Rhomi1/193025/gm1.1239_g